MKNKKLFVNLFCVLMAVVMCIGMLHPIVASAGTKEDYRAAQERLDKINKEIDLDMVVNVLDNYVTENQRTLKTLIDELEGVKESDTVTFEIA